MKKLFFVILGGLIWALFILSNIGAGGILCPKANASEPARFIGDTVPALDECLEMSSGVLDVGGSGGTIGQEVQVPVNIQSAPDKIFSLGFEVTYDSSVLEYLDYTGGDLTASFTVFDIYPAGTGRLRVGGLTIGDGIAQGASGCVAVLNFRVIGGVDNGCYAVKLENLRDDVTSFSSSQGCFCMNDTIPPELTCPADGVIAQTENGGAPIDDPDVQAFLASAVARDNADGKVAVINDAPSVLPPGESTITFTATDRSGNSASCSATITVQPPECAEDNSGALNIEGAQGNLGDEIQIPVMIHAAPAEASALGFEVIYQPSVLEYSGFVKGDLVSSFVMFDVILVGSGRLRVGGLTTGESIPRGTSGCVVVLAFKVKGGVDNGCYAVKLENLRDDVTSFSSSQGCFCMNDTIPPELTCPADGVVAQTVNGGTPINDPDVQAFLSGAMARDNADGKVAVINDAPSILPPGKSIITFTATDRSGNSISCSATITVHLPRCTEDESGTLDIEGAQGKAGDEIEIPVRLQAAPHSVSALGFEITYNPSVLEYSGNQRGDLVSSFTLFDVNPAGSGRLRAGGLTTGESIPQGTSGCVAVLKFKVKGGMEGGCYPVALENLRDDLTQLSSSQGCFCIRSCSGDLNGDGFVTPTDSLIVFQCFLNQGPCSDCTDVNQDGTTSPADALCLFQHFLGSSSCLNRQRLR
ncbi:MAG: cohesin domain-containing protein [bacterium]